MPVKVVQRNSRFRVVEAATGNIAKNPDTNRALDGGGHTSKAKAQAQANAINASKK